MKIFLRILIKSIYSEGSVLSPSDDLRGHGKQRSLRQGVHNEAHLVLMLPREMILYNFEGGKGYHTGISVRRKKNQMMSLRLKKLQACSESRMLRMPHRCGALQKGRKGRGGGQVRLSVPPLSTDRVSAMSCCDLVLALTAQHPEKLRNHP